MMSLGRPYQDLLTVWVRWGFSNRSWDCYYYRGNRWRLLDCCSSSFDSRHEKWTMDSSFGGSLRRKSLPNSCQWSYSLRCRSTKITATGPMVWQPQIRLKASDSMEPSWEVDLNCFPCCGDSYYSGYLASFHGLISCLYDSKIPSSARFAQHREQDPSSCSRWRRPRWHCLSGVSGRQSTFAFIVDSYFMNFWVA